MIIEDLKNIIEKNLENKTNEVKRVFHGRGNFYDNFSYLTVDSFDSTLFATFFEESFDEKEIIKALEIISKNSDFENFIIQRKYKEKDFYEIIYGEIVEDFFVYENNLKYKIDFKNRNIGFNYINLSEDKGSTSYAVPSPEQIHILGSKQDIEMFKTFMFYASTEQESKTTQAQPTVIPTSIETEFKYNESLKLTPESRVFSFSNNTETTLSELVNNLTNETENFVTYLDNLRNISPKRKGSFDMNTIDLLKALEEYRKNLQKPNPEITC